MADRRESEAMGIGNAPLTPLEQPVTELRGVGPERAALLARLGIRTVGDLLLHRPRRYEDRRRLERIAGELNTLVARFRC